MKKYVIANYELYDTTTGGCSSYEKQLGCAIPPYTTDGHVLIKHYMKYRDRCLDNTATHPPFNRFHEIIGEIQRESDGILGLLRCGDYCKLSNDGGDLILVDKENIHTITVDDVKEIWITRLDGELKRIWTKVG